MPIVQRQTKGINEASGVIVHIAVKVDIPAVKLDRVFADEPL